MTTLLALKRSARALLATAGLAMGLLVTGCGGGGGSSDTPVDPLTPTGTLSGTVVSAATGETLPNVQISAGARSATSDAAGHYTLTEVPAADPVVVSFALANHATTFASVPLSAQTSATANARLVPVSTTGSVDAAAGGTVTVPNSTAQVTLPAGGLATSSGATASGAVTVAVTVIDPAANPGNMPGNYTTDDGKTIESFGALTVTLQDAAGQKLNLAAGQTATIRIPVSTRAADTPATIPLYYFNEVTGRWVQEGTAKLMTSGAARYYEGQVGHFSTWNCDRPMETINVYGCVADAAGVRQPGVLVQTEGTSYAGNAARTTDANGEFIVPMQKNGIAALWGERDAGFTNVLSEGPAEADIHLSTCLVLGSSGQAPQIISPPKDTTVVPQSWALFGVAAIGSQPLSYQWKRNGVNVGDNSNHVLLYPVSTTDSGASYTVTVRNAYGSVTSPAAVLTVDASVPPTILLQPTAMNVAVGSSATFSVTALANGGTLNYQWLKNGSAISGATAASYTTPATTLADNGALYAVRVASSNGLSVTSANAALGVSALTAPSITQQPQAASVSVGQSASFSVAASGSPAPTYQWRRNGSDIPGAAAASYTTPATTLADNGASYTVVVSNTAGSVTSHAVALTVTQVVTQSGYHVVTGAGPVVDGTLRYADRVQSISSPAIVAINVDHPGAGAITLEAAGQASALGSAALEATVSGGQVTQARSRHVVYAKGSRFYKVDQVVSGSGVPTAALLTSLSTTQVCSGNSDSPLTHTTVEAQDRRNPARSWLFVSGPGNDGQCNTSDDTTYAARIDMDGSTAPLSLSVTPLATLLDSSAGITGFIVRSGNTLQRVDADFGAAENLYTVSGTLVNLGNTTTGTLPGVWVYSEGSTVWAVNLATPATRVAVATLASGEVASEQGLDSAAGAFYVQIDSSTRSRIVRVSAALTATPVATFSAPVSDYALGSSRLVARLRNGSLASVALGGGTPSTILQPASGSVVGEWLVGGDTVYANLLNYSALSTQVTVMNSDGSNSETLANTAMLGQIKPAVMPLSSLSTPYAVLLASPVSTLLNQSGATVRAVQVATRAPLVSYGSLPANVAGMGYLGTGFGGLQYGMRDVLNVANLNSGSVDLFSLDTDAVGLSRETNFLSGTLAAPRTNAQALTLRSLAATGARVAR
jgi:hypothetical protein